MCCNMCDLFVATVYYCEVNGEKTSSMIKITFYLDSLSAKRKKEAGSIEIYGVC